MLSRINRNLGTHLLYVVLLLITTDTHAQDVLQTWNQWRGPGRDGVVFGPTWPSNLTSDNLRPVWSFNLQPGYSTPLVSEKTVFVTETRDKKTEWVTALDRISGQIKWSVQWPGSISVPFFAKANGDWIRATPAYDGKNLYVAGIRDVLVCLDGESGSEVWRVDFPEQFKTEAPAFGFASSPLVTSDAIYVQAGGGVVKVNKSNGVIIWKALDDGGGMSGSAFSSPVIYKIAGVEQLVVQTRTVLAGLDLESGDVLWSQEVEAFRGMNILTPTLWKDQLFTSSYGGGTFLFLITKNDTGWQVTQQWRNKVQGYMSSPIVIDDHAYLHLRNQRFACLDLLTGKEAWITTPFGKYWSLVAQGNQIIALDEEGELRLIQADPKEFQLISDLKVATSPAWAHLVVCNNEVYVRELDKLTKYTWK